MKFLVWQTKVSCGLTHQVLPKVYVSHVFRLDAHQQTPKSRLARFCITENTHCPHNKVGGWAKLVESHHTQSPCWISDDQTEKRQLQTRHKQKISRKQVCRSDHKMANTQSEYPKQIPPNQPLTYNNHLPTHSPSLVQRENSQCIPALQLTSQGWSLRTDYVCWMILQSSGPSQIQYKGNFPKNGNSQLAVPHQLQLVMQSVTDCILKSGTINWFQYF